MAEKRLHLRTTFDESALLYDKVRPGYPYALFAYVVSLSGIPSGGAYTRDRLRHRPGYGALCPPELPHPVRRVG